MAFVFRKKTVGQSSAVIKESMANHCFVVREETVVVVWKTLLIMCCASAMSSVKELETVVLTLKVSRNHVAWEKVCAAGKV